MININLIEENISVSIGEDFYVIPHNAASMKRLSDLAAQANFAKTYEDYEIYVREITTLVEENGIDSSALIQSKCDHIVQDPLTKEFFLTYGDDKISTMPMPQSLVDRIMDSIDKNIDFLPVIKLWTRFLRNPLLKNKGADFAERFADFVNMRYVHPANKAVYLEKGLAEDVAIELATVYQIKITNEGLLNGYKVSRELLHSFDVETGEKVDRYKRTFNVDTGEIESEGLPQYIEDRVFEPAVMSTGGDAFYCGENKGHHIKVGQTHSLESWDQINTNDNATCVPGLHIGGLRYIAWYAGEIHNVFVDPMHIGAIPDSSDGAIRCLQYFVHSSLAGVNGSMYHSSTYAAMTDEQWATLRLEIMTGNLEKVEQLRKEDQLLEVM
tara:strand:- start:4930 stop:6078 length:1149 start_codon:yes stop_codon:yes gene_type:complete